MGDNLGGCLFLFLVLIGCIISCVVSGNNTDRY